MDNFILRNHEGKACRLLDISNLPTDFDKLVGFCLDPLIYRISWLGPDNAYIWEFWWGTTPFTIHRVSNKDISSRDLNNLTEFTYNIKSTKSKGLPRGGAASPSHLHTNFMI
jgi:hypothetical protein